MTKEQQTDTKPKIIQVEMTEDDELMVDVIDFALKYLERCKDFQNRPVTVKEMRDWMKSKFPSKYRDIN